MRANSDSLQIRLRDKNGARETHFILAEQIKTWYENSLLHVDVANGSPYRVFFLINYDKEKKRDPSVEQTQ